jgi:hypothetical protein
MQCLTKKKTPPDGSGGVEEDTELLSSVKLSHDPRSTRSGCAGRFRSNVKIDIATQNSEDGVCSVPIQAL